LTKNETPSQEGGANDKPRKQREWGTAFVGFLFGMLGLCLSRLGLIWPDFDVFSQFTIQFVFWTISFAIVPVFFRRLPSTAALAATVCLCVIYGLWPSLREHNPILNESVSRPHLVFATYNIYKNNRDLRQLADNVRTFQADVVVLVEVTFAQQDVLKLLATEYPHQVICHELDYNCDVAILSRYPIVDQSPPIHTGANYQWAQVETPLGKIDFVGYHSSRFPHSRVQFRQTGEIVKQLEKRPRPLVVAGDFNATPTSRTINMIADNSGLTVLNSLPTWPASHFLPQLAIDQIMISKELTALTSVNAGLAGGSDHLPLIVTLGKTEKLQATR
jgi:endonuclease/exonuclease/phosphatase (EEP) superfamily protein YafD